MVSAMAAVPEVSEPRLSAPPGSRGRLLLTYRYRHRDGKVLPETVDISDLVRGGSDLVLGGLFGPAGLDDADSGMLRITGLWQSKCGMTLRVVTV
jgi:hypothetical protein